MRVVARPDFPRSILEFQRRFADERACLEYLAASHLCVLCTWRDPFLGTVLQNKIFDYMAADANNPVTLTGIAEPVQLRSNQVTAEFFEVFGIRAALGRTFFPATTNRAARSSR